MKRLAVLPLSFLLAACSSARSTESASPYRVDISAAAERIPAGGAVTVTGTVVGAYENPRYYITVTDRTPAASEFERSLQPDNTVIATTGASSVLELVSTEISLSELTVVFRGKAPGSADVTIGVTGQVGRRDSSGRWYFDYISRASTPIRVTVD